MRDLDGRLTWVCAWRQPGREHGLHPDHQLRSCRPERQNRLLDLLAVGQTPSRAIVPIGPVTTHTEGAGEDRDMAVIRLKERACMSGAHGLMQDQRQSRADWRD